MAKNRQVTQKAALKAAAEVVRKRGAQALNARAVAKEIGCSTQPVYSLFGNMDGLKRALYGEAKAEYHRFIEGYLEKEGRSRYEAYGMGFAKFAREERGLFRFLFSEQRESGGEADPFLGKILAEMCSLYRMTEEQARAFHADMTVFSYGLAMLLNTGQLEATDEEISEMFKREFYGLYAVHFPRRPHFWEK